jgi:hypothetical protein
MAGDNGVLIKTCLTSIVVLIAAGLPNAASEQISAAQVSTVCGEAALPAPINDLLKSKFAGWRPERTSDLYPDDQKFWSEKHPKECPGIAAGHFESADTVSYAVLLVPAAKQRSGFQIIAFSEGPKTDAYSMKVLEQAEGKDQFAPVIYKVPPGKYVGFDDTKSVRLKLDGINVEWIEKSSYIYYWWGGRYHRIWTSD